MAISNVQPRDPGIEVVKAWGILCVVFAHVFSGLPSQVIFIFHMPLFFFLSGYLFTLQPAKQYLIKKAVHLLLPYAVYLILFNVENLEDLFRALLNFDWAALKSVGMRFLRQLYGGRFLISEIGVFWFMTCLFMTQQVYAALLRFCGAGIKYIVGVFYLLALCNQYLCSKLFFPWDINVVLCSMLFFHCGYRFKQTGMTDKKMGWESGFLAVLAVILLGAGVPLQMDMKTTNYGVPFLTVLFALAMIFLILKLAKSLAGFKSLAGVLGWVGGASMTIMFLHQYINIYMDQGLDVRYPIIRFAFALLIPLLLHWIFMRFTWTRLLFLGATASQPATFSKGRDK